MAAARNVALRSRIASLKQAFARPLIVHENRHVQNGQLKRLNANSLSADCSPIHAALIGLRICTFVEHVISQAIEPFPKAREITTITRFTQQDATAKGMAHKHRFDAWGGCGTFAVKPISG